jgi:hypothetical protein
MSSIIRHRKRVIVISLRSKIGWVDIDPARRRDILNRSDRRCRASLGEAVQSNELKPP